MVKNVLFVMKDQGLHERVAGLQEWLIRKANKVSSYTCLFETIGLDHGVVFYATLMVRSGVRRNVSQGYLLPRAFRCRQEPIS